MRNPFEAKVWYLAKAKQRAGGWSCAGLLNPDGKGKDSWRLIVPVPVLMAYFGVGSSAPISMQDYYQVLAIPQNAGPDELKRGYRRMAKQWHPDVCQEEDANERFGRIQVAYDALRDPQSRRKYDAFLAMSGTTPRIETEPGRPPQEDYQPPVRCGIITGMANITKTGWWIVQDIANIEDIYDEQGRTLVTSWGGKGLVKKWVTE